MYSKTSYINAVNSDLYSNNLITYRYKNPSLKSAQINYCGG